MTIHEAIDVRRSRRKYIPEPLDSTIVEQLRALAKEYCQAGNCRMELVFNNGSAFNGLRKSYGMFSGAEHYAGLIADKNDAEATERLGYYGELFMLHAVALGLGTCWVGGSFSRKECPFELTPNEQIVCTISLGQTPEQNSFRERLIYNITHRKTKSMEDMYVSDSPVPDWFISGMRAVQKAPSAVNKQPVVFSYKEGKVTATIANPTNSGNLLDMGIAKLHFELGAGGGKWAWGNGGGYTREL